VIYIETCRDPLYDSLYIIYSFLVYELLEQSIFKIYLHRMESNKFGHCDTIATTSFSLVSNYFMTD
jgi:hypothetical protein